MRYSVFVIFELSSVKINTVASTQDVLQETPDVSEAQGSSNLVLPSSTLYITMSPSQQGYHPSA
jgi:hypothetical protein